MKPVKSSNMKRGASILSLLFLGCFLIVLARFIYIMATGHIHGVNLLEGQEKVVTASETIKSTRGEIRTREGKKLAVQSQVYSIVAILSKKNDNHVKDISHTAEKLSGVLNADTSKIEALLTKDKNAYQVELGKIGKNITITQMQKISKLKLPGIVLIPEMKRTYPLGDFASHIVGLTNFEGEGIAGIEKQYSPQLTGEDGFIKQKVDGFINSGLSLPSDATTSKPPKNGNHIITTIDRNIQTVLEDAMNQVINNYQPEKIIAIVMDPKTGEIVALSNRPSLYPNKENEVNYLNYAISYPFEPGSTMKIFTLAAAINEGVYNGNEQFKSGSITISGETIHDHNDHGWGMITYDKGVQLSSNVAFTIIAKDKLGFDKYYDYLHDFGFTSTTGIDLSGEKKGTLLKAYEIEKATTSFGQGSTISPIQLVTAASAIANDGKMMRPYVIKQVMNDEEEVLKEKVPEVTGTPISKEAALETRNLLATVVNDGTGKKFQLAEYEVAGKTGTAQIPDGNGRYQTGRNNYIFSFLGMAPVQDPKLIVYVAVEKPQLAADEVGANPVSEIVNPVMEYGLKKLDATADKGTKKVTKIDVASVSLENYENKPVTDAVEELKKTGLEPIVLGNGKKIIETSPAKGEQVLNGTNILLKTDGAMIMPDLKNWSLREINQFSRFTGLEVQREGNGFVTSQSIKPGAKVGDGVLKVKLE
ncbi:penicillin-binding protein [Metabacillus malikii]|uniref:serine-type D-Ala-D-Ala carboxypeptidase n=1 Tax=Metabacillus malikii TaxID=1504265 RepID=A0ABT9ZAI9_9BACI|nr:PASTA domain-containing penicillin-binding protein [Metabacillus malikii]MDQ0229035.1 penicillin-binding protein 2B [Metabacillus malikii]